VLINDEDVSPREDVILTAINQEVDMLGKELEDDIDTPKSTGVVKYHLLYDTYNDDEGNVMPTTSGYFEEQIKLPFTGGSIANPWLCESAANYLEGQWLKESALWSRGLVSLLKTANDKHIYDNNMHMEVVIKHAKKQPDRILNCGEPALYFHSRYTDLKQSNRQFVIDLEKAKNIVRRRKENAQFKNTTSQSKTTDATENEMLMKEDAVWDNGRKGPEAELNLRRQLEEIMVEVHPHRNYQRWYNTLEGYVLDTGVGNLEGMGYRTFLDWMKGKRNKRDSIKGGAMKAMKNFVDNYSA